MIEIDILEQILDQIAFLQNSVLKLLVLPIYRENHRFYSINGSVKHQIKQKPFKMVSFMIRNVQGVLKAILIWSKCVWVKKSTD